MSQNSFNTKRQLTVGDQQYFYHDLTQLRQDYPIDQLPFCLKVLLENLLHHEDGVNVTKDDIVAVCARSYGNDDNNNQIAFSPARVILQDFTGVPALVDLAAMRDAIAQLGGDADKINPLVPVDLVIDHSVMVDHYASLDALAKNMKIEYQRNQERYNFLRWGQQAFKNFRVVPPGTGIVHQVNLEYLASCVMTKTDSDEQWAYPDTLVGTDSHTTMINGLGVLGWGVGGIEAEAAMLGQPITMLLPEVVGFELSGELPEGATATDLVLTVTEMLRQKGVVGKFVEFFGDGLTGMSLADRATLANMAPEYGATCGIFPIDAQTLTYLDLTGRSAQNIALVETYAKQQGMWRDDTPTRYDDTLSLELADVVPSLAGPKRPQDRVALPALKTTFNEHLKKSRARHKDRILTEPDKTSPPVRKTVTTSLNGQLLNLSDGDVVIAAITSCTNTSNPSVMLAAGLVAQKAHALGLNVKPWVKTSLAPGSQVVPAYLKKAGLLDDLEALGFHVVGYGCTTCIGNSGPLPDAIRDAIHQGDLNVASVLSGNRNFEGRIHADVQANFLGSPPLVVAYALAGTVDIDITTEVIGQSQDGKDVYLKDIWPTMAEINALRQETVDSALFQSRYADVFTGDEAWQSLPASSGKTYNWPDSTYIKNPPYFEGMTQSPKAPTRIEEARCLIKVGDSITTDHISPAGAIHPDSPAGQYLRHHHVPVKDFNSLGSRRGNHEVMMRGTFANVRLQNHLAPDTNGGVTRHLPDGDVTSIFETAEQYRAEKTPLIVLAGKEYGTGSSRDWAAKGTKLLGIEAVIAESFERIHRSNLVGFGVLPLQFMPKENAQTLGLTGEEVFSLSQAVDEQTKTLSVTATGPDGVKKQFMVQVRIDTATEWSYFYNGGILQTVLRKLSA